MLPFFSTQYANASSEIHQIGRIARQAVERARCQVAELIGAQPEEILFTSSATESNNLAIFGVAKAGQGTRRVKVLLSAIEHKSVIEPCRLLEADGFEASSIPVDVMGRVDIERYRCALNDQTFLASIQAANNEIGTIQPVSLLSELAHEQGVIFHCDAAQAAGKIPVDVVAMGIDLLSVSAHKMYGPKGVAALYIRGGVARSKIKPLLYGGDQEWGLRPGSLNVPLIVGFGEACRIAGALLTEESTHLALMRDGMEAKLLAAIPRLKRNGDLDSRLPHNSNLTFPGQDAEELILSTPDVALSTGSACNAGAQDPSYVLRAIGLSHEEAQCTLRIGLGRFTEKADCDRASVLLCDAARRLALAGRGCAH
jgi:cysteine desulfurase